MNRSFERAAATRWKNGRSAMRPTPAITASAKNAEASVHHRSARPPSADIDITSSSGATSRSWNSSTEKIARPEKLLSRFFSASTGTTTAVEDSASAIASVADAGQLKPKSRANTISASPQAATCAAPKPNT